MCLMVRYFFHAFFFNVVFNSVFFWIRRFNYQYLQTVSVADDTTEIQHWQAAQWNRSNLKRRWMWEKDIITPKRRIRANKKKIYNKSEKIFLCTKLKSRKQQQKNQRRKLCLLLQTDHIYYKQQKMHYRHPKCL